MNKLILNERVTMSSREIELKELQDSILEGRASFDLVNKIAFTAIGYAYSLIEIDLDEISELTKIEASKKLHKIEEAQAYLRCIAQSFDKYFWVQETLMKVEQLLSYAYATLVPFYLFYNKSKKKSNGETKTYFIKNPILNQIKIGRTTNLKQRLEALHCGAGTPLLVLKVLDGNKENEFHRRFCHLRVLGEWFDDSSQEITKFINSLGGVAQ